MFSGGFMSRDNYAVMDGTSSEGSKRGVAASSFFAVAVSVVYPLVMIVYSFVGGAVLQISSSLAGATVFLVLLFKQTRMSGEKKIIMVLMIFFLFLCGWYGALWTNMRSYGAILVLLSCLGVAWATLEFGLGKYVYEYPFFVFLSVTGVLIAVGTDQYEFNEVLAVGSRNVYSAILLVFAIGYLFSKKIRGERTSIVLGVALVVVSFFLYSRTGLALAFALFFPFLLGSRLAIRRKFLFLFFVACLPALLLIPVIFDVGDFLARNSNFEKGLDSPRFAIWKSYFINVDIFNLLFGYDLNRNELIAEFGGNPHSAYLRLHSYFGIGLLFMFFFFLLSAFKLVKEKRWIFIFLASCFFFRAAFDPVYFIWIFDYVLYPFVFFVFFDDYFPSVVRPEARFSS